MAIEIWMKFSLSTNVSGASQRDRIATFFQTTKTAEEKYETAPYSSSNTIQFSESPEIPNWFESTFFTPFFKMKCPL